MQDPTGKALPKPQPSPEGTRASILFTHQRAFIDGWLTAAGNPPEETELLTTPAPTGVRRDVTWYYGWGTYTSRTLEKITISRENRAVRTPFTVRLTAPEKREPL